MFQHFSHNLGSNYHENISYMLKKILHREHKVCAQRKRKNKACNFQDRLGRKPKELRRISSASKRRSPPSLGRVKIR